jgi:hypothetical protein
LGKLKIAAYGRQGERATSFAMACNLLGRYVHQNGAAAANLGLGIRKGERAAGDSGVELGVFFFVRSVEWWEVSFRFV